MHTAARYLPSTHPRDMAAACVRAALFWAPREDLWYSILEHQRSGRSASFSADTTSALAITLRSFFLALGSALQMPRPPPGSQDPVYPPRGEGWAGLVMEGNAGWVMEGNAGMVMEGNWSYLLFPACPQGHLACYFAPFLLFAPALPRGGGAAAGGRGGAGGAGGGGGGGGEGGGEGGDGTWSKNEKEAGKMGLFQEAQMQKKKEQERERERLFEEAKMRWFGTCCINLPVQGAEVAIPPKWRVNGVFWYVSTCLYTQTHVCVRVFVLVCVCVRACPHPKH